MEKNKVDLYQHCKGGLYIVYCEAKHSESGEELVIYSSVADGRIYARPKEMFHGQVEIDGKKGPRFIKVPPVVQREKLDKLWVL